MHHGILSKKFSLERAKHHHHHHHDDEDSGGLFSSCFGEEKHDCHDHENIIIIDKYTLTRNGTFYQFWLPILVLANLTTNIIYPGFTIKNSDEQNHYSEHMEDLLGNDIEEDLDVWANFQNNIIEFIKLMDTE